MLVRGIVRALPWLALAVLGFRSGGGASAQSFCGIPTSGAPVECSGTSPKCWDGAAPDPSEAMPVNLTVAHFGDQGIGSDSRSVMQMCLNEGVELMIHAGDFSYNCRGDDWMDNVESVVGTSFPYFAAGGNHDSDTGSTQPCSDRWSNSVRGYQKVLYDHNVRQGAKCEGEVGVNQVCTYKGLTVVLSGVGTQGARPEDFIAQSLTKYGGRWRVCAWHKNQNLLQLGGKSNEVGWQAYETCRQHGAWIQTGHEHSYSRTYTMSHMESQTVVNTNNNVVVDTDQSFVAVSGVAGIGVRVCQNGYENNPWWASAWCSGDGLLDGALICKYNYNGNADQAYCYFKQRDGVVRDTFMIQSNMPAWAPPPPPPPPVCDQVIPISAQEDDAEQPAAGGAVSCSSSDLELVRDGSDQVIGLRFLNVDLDAASMSRVSRVRISFTNDDTEGPYSEATNLVFHGDRTDNSPTFCSGTDILSRPRTTASVAWNNLPTFTGPSHHFSPDLTPVVQEIVSGSGWSAGDAMTFMISGTGKRVVNSFSRNCPPVLYIEASCPGSPSTTTTTTTTTTSGTTTTTTASGTTTTTTTTTGTTATTGTTGCSPKTCGDYVGQCGSFPDDCGNLISCSCPAQTPPLLCLTNQTCRACIPETCLSLGTNCGSHSDGCGASISCGTCAAGETCFAGRTCQSLACTPSQSCATDSCGTLFEIPCVEDASRNTSVTCGSCSFPDTCSVSDLQTEVGTCSCIPSACPAGESCGTRPDGCGGVVSCGTCNVNTPCQSATRTCGQVISCSGANQELRAGACLCKEGFVTDPNSSVGDCVASGGNQNLISGASQRTLSAACCFAWTSLLVLLFGR